MTVYESGLKIAHAAIALLAATAPPVAAQPAPAPPPDATGEPGELTAADVAGAPVPGDESGRVDVPERDSTARRTARAVLWVPRKLVEIILAPFQLPIWAYDRYQLKDLYYWAFYNEDRTLGLVPIATYETDFGFSVGARLIANNVAGDNEQASLSAQFGGAYHQAYQGYLNSGDRLGDRVQLELYGEYEKRPRDIFYGIGNVSTTTRPAMPVDPYVVPVAYETRFRQRIERIAGVINARLFGDLYLASSNERGDRAFSPATYGTPIDEVFKTSTLVGWPSTSYFYSELALRFDTRGRYNLFEPAPFLSVGTLAELWGGRTLWFDGNPDFWRYGLNLQHFIRIGEGPRVIALRFRGEGVSGSLADVPFAMLPRLGGPRDLRGYTTDRFRDRVAAVGSVEYNWDLAYNIAAALFVDVGRVYSSIEDMTYHDLRCGFGVSLRFFSETSFWLDLSLASSVNGGVQVTASFDPVYLIKSRVRRR